MTPRQHKLVELLHRDLKPRSTYHPSNPNVLFQNNEDEELVVKILRKVELKPYVVQLGNFPPEIVYASHFEEAVYAVSKYQKAENGEKLEAKIWELSDDPDYTTRVEAKTMTDWIIEYDL